MTVKIWWSGNSNGTGNFGDVITPLLFDYFNINYEFSENSFEAISTGSIARRAVNGTVVLGSGIITKHDKLCPSADWRFVRGPYTRNKLIELGANFVPRVYGDPGLLLPLIAKPSKPLHSIGIVPHFTEYHKWSKRLKDYFVIDLKTKDPLNVIEQITSCERIISSSLHGIICAHAYGIPAAWIRLSDNLKGDSVKFDDYYAGVGLVAELSTISDPIYTVPKYSTDAIEQIFQEYADDIRNRSIPK